MTQPCCGQSRERACYGRPDGEPRALETVIPIYEFECEECGARFEELVAVDAAAPACAACGAARTHRLLSNVSPPGRQPRGAAVRSDESRRGEREAARADRISESRKRRALGETP